MTEMRDRILDAATRLYLRQGTERATLSAIAEEAGVSRPTVYKYVGGVVLPRLTTRGRPVIDAAIDVLEPYLVEARDTGQIRRVEPRRAAEWITRIGISLILSPLPAGGTADDTQVRTLLDEMFQATLSRG